MVKEADAPPFNPGPRERRAMELYLYWRNHLAPDLGPDLDGYEDLFRSALFSGFEDDADKEDAEGIVYDPEHNEELALVAALAACDGYLPSGTERARPPSDRIRIRELALLLDADTKRLSGCLRSVGVSPRTIRFGQGTAKGFYRDDILGGWKREAGLFQDQQAEISGRRRR